MSVPRRRRLVAVFGSCALLGGGVAYAVSEPPSTDSATAHIVFTHVGVNERTCPAADGSTFIEQRVVVQGVATGDPRLSGEVELHATLFTTAEDEPGTQVGTLRIREPGGAWKAQGRFVLAAGGLVYTGSVAGDVRDPARAGGTRSTLISPFQLVFGEDGSVTADLGGHAPADIDAVLVRGHCTGPFERFEQDIPAPGGGNGVAALRAAGAGWR
jgi:hypothetical protein